MNCCNPAIITMLSMFACAPAFAQENPEVLSRVITSPAPLNDHIKDGQVDLNAAMARKLNTQNDQTLRRCSYSSPKIHDASGISCPAHIVPKVATSASSKAISVLAGSAIEIAAPEKNGALELSDAAKARHRVTGPVFRVIETKKAGTYNDLVIDGLDADTTRDGIRLQGTVERVILRNVTIRHATTPNLKPDLPECISIRNGADIRLEHVRCEGFYMTDKAGGVPSFSYPRNGDIVAVESGVGPIYINDLVGIGASDSLLDFLKGHDLTVGTAYGRKVARCLKSGAPRVHIAILDCGDTRASGIEVKGNDAVVDLFRYDFTGMTKPIVVFSAEKGGSKSASLTVSRCEFTGVPPVGTKLKVAGSGTAIDLGPTCKLP